MQKIDFLHFSALSLAQRGLPASWHKGALSASKRIFRGSPLAKAVFLNQAFGLEVSNAVLSATSGTAFAVFKSPAAKPGFFTMSSRDSELNLLKPNVFCVSNSAD